VTWSSSCWQSSSSRTPSRHRSDTACGTTLRRDRSEADRRSSILASRFQLLIEASRPLNSGQPAIRLHAPGACASSWFGWTDASRRFRRSVLNEMHAITLRDRSPRTMRSTRLSRASVGGARRSWRTRRPTRTRPRPQGALGDACEVDTSTCGSKTTRPSSPPSLHIAPAVSRARPAPRSPPLCQQGLRVQALGSARRMHPTRRTHNARGVMVEEWPVRPEWSSDERSGFDGTTDGAADVSRCAHPASRALSVSYNS
jgi:hypothetical protein